MITDSTVKHWFVAPSVADLRLVVGAALLVSSPAFAASALLQTDPPAESSPSPVNGTAHALLALRSDRNLSPAPRTISTRAARVGLLTGADIEALVAADCGHALYHEPPARVAVDK